MEDVKTLKEHLLNEFPFRVELHTHTKPMSGCSEITPEELVKRYAALHIHGVVITNHAHFRAKDEEKATWCKRYLDDYRNAVSYAKDYNLRIYLGLEMKFAKNENNEYLVYGADESFIETAWEYLSQDIHTFYEACHDPDRVIVQAHPFRGSATTTNPADIDGVEVFNHHPGHNSRTSLAANYHKQVGGIVTGGSDFHHPNEEGQFLACFRELPIDSYDLARRLRAGEYIFLMGDSVILP